MKTTSLIVVLLTGLLMAGAAEPSATNTAPPIYISKKFEGGSLGKVEKLDENSFRCYVEGQYDSRGRNRQASWFSFQMENVLGRELNLTMTDYVGEYNDKPGACPMTADLRPVYSYDNKTWQHFTAMDWDDTKKEATLHLKATSNVVWISHQVPYTHSRLLGLLKELDEKPFVRIETMGKTVEGRDLHVVTITNPDIPDAGKKCVWLQARQHAWEAGTSFVMEGALKFITSGDPKAVALRDKVIFRFTPMVDPDGVVNGKVRFNGNGFDVNRHWKEMDLRDKTLLQRMPEIWYTKKTILGWVDGGHSIDLMLNMHNTETAEYIDTMADDEVLQARMQVFFQKLVTGTIFDPSRKMGITPLPSNTTNSLYHERKIPVMLMELRIGPSRKLGRMPTHEDRLEFGRGLITSMAETVLE